MLGIYKQQIDVRYTRLPYLLLQLDESNDLTTYLQLLNLLFLYEWYLMILMSRKTFKKYYLYLEGQRVKIFSLLSTILLTNSVSQYLSLFQF